MAGISIPIGGNTSGLKQALAEVTSAVRDLAAAMRADFAKVNSSTSAVAAGTRSIGQAGKEAAGGIKGMVASASSAGAHIANIVAGAQAMKTVFNAVRATSLGASLATALSTAGGLRAMMAGVGARIREIVSSPGFRKIALGALAATVAIGGTVVAIKAVRASFSLLSAAAAATFRGIVSAAKSAGAAVKGAFSGMGKIFSGGGGGGIAGMLGPLAGAAGALGLGALIGKAISKGAEMEMMETNFGVMTGSSEKARKMLAELRKESVASPLGMGDFAKSAQTLMQFGVSAQKVVGYTKQLSEISMGDPERFQSLSLAFAQIQSAGRLMGQDLLQLVNAGFNPLQQISGKTGESMVALKERMEEGKISFNEIEAAFTAATSKGGRFYQMNITASATFAGAIARIKDSWEQLLISFGTPIMNALKPFLQQGSAMMDAMQVKAGEVGKAIGDALMIAFVAVKSGNLWGLVEAGGKVAFQAAADTLMRGLRGVVAFLATAVPPILAGAMAKIQDPSFWDGLLNIFRSIGTTLAAEIKSALPLADMNEIAMMRRKGALQGEKGRLQMSNAGGAIDMGMLAARALAAGGAAAKIAAGGAITKELQDALKELAEYTSRFKAETEKLKLNSAVPTINAGTDVKAGVGGTVDAIKGAVNAITIASSMSRIGLGGGGAMVFQPMVAAQQKNNQLVTQTNTLLKTIASQLNGSGGATYA